MAQLTRGGGVRRRSVKAHLRAERHVPRVDPGQPGGRHPPTLVQSQEGTEQVWRCTVCLSQLLFARLNYCLPVSTSVCLSQLLSALSYCLPSN